MRATQWVQPWEYGHPEAKRTGLWLSGLPELSPTDVLDPPSCGHWANQTPSGQNKVGEQRRRSEKRSRTYTGIAAAMATQWGVI